VPELKRMKMIVRFRLDGKVRGGSLSLEENRIVSSGDILSLDEVELLAPCQPSKIVCVGLNYTEHAQELKMQLPAEPVLFIKPPSAILGPAGQIIYPPSSQRLDYEGELAVVMGKRCKNILAKDLKNAFSVTPASTTSPPAIFSAKISSGRGPRASTPSPPSAPGSPRSIPQMPPSKPA